MFSAITFSILIITLLSLVILWLVNRSFTYGWPIAAVGAFLAWISSFFWLIDTPATFSLLNLQGQGIIRQSISLTVSEVSLPFGIGITSLTLASVLVSAIGARETKLPSWVSILTISIFGLLAVLSDNLIALVIAWALLDLTGLLASLNASENSAISKGAILAYSLRTVGVGLALWIGVLAQSSGNLTFPLASSNSQGLIVIAAVLSRTGANLIRVPFSNERINRRTINTFFQLATTATTVVLLSHLDLGLNEEILSILLAGVLLIFGILSVIYWLRSPRDTSDQHYWTMGLVVISIITAVSGNGVGSTAWGSAVLFSGGLLFLHLARNRILTIILTLAVYILSTLPLSLTSSTWTGNYLENVLIVVLLIPLLAFIAAGYLRSILKDEKENLGTHPRWVRIFYPMGLIILFSTGLLLGFLTWEVKALFGLIIASAILAFLTTILTVVLLRIPLNKTPEISNVEKPIPGSTSISFMAQSLFRGLGRLISLLTSTFEGDGGVLWTILILMIFISLMGIYTF